MSTRGETDASASAVKVAAADPSLARNDERRALRRLVGMLLFAVAAFSLVEELPSLHHVAGAIAHMSPGWIVVAVALEIASCASFVIVFRMFFDSLPGAVARELAWAEMGSGALLPGGGVGAFAVGGWLLHRAGMSTRRILESSSGLFFLTSAVNIAAIILAGIVLAAGGHGQHDFIHAVAPVIGAAGIAAFVVALPSIGGRRGTGRHQDILRGIIQAEGALLAPGWRLLGALGYLGFDIAVLWTIFAATGRHLPVGAVVLSYMLGYLANLIPIPGGMGVLEAGLAGMLVLYGAPAPQAIAATLIYHAIAFWIPSIGGIAGYARMRCRLRNADRAAAPVSSAPPLHASSELRLGSSCRWGLRRSSEIRHPPASKATGLGSRHR